MMRDLYSQMEAYADFAENGTPNAEQFAIAHGLLCIANAICGLRETLEKINESGLGDTAGYLD